MNLLRFDPARDSAGRPAQSVYHRSFLWLTSDPSPFGPARVTVSLTLAAGRVTGCSLTSEGSTPPEWTKFPCRHITSEIGYYLAARRNLVKRAKIVFEAVPTGGSLPRSELADRVPAAEWRSEFRLGRNGDVGDCRKVLDRGFGPVTENQKSPCGFFLTRTWFQPADPNDRPSGLFALKVYPGR
jgi:hypothetical protein